MAKKVKPSQVVKEIDDIVRTFSGKPISAWVQEAWAKSQNTTIGQAAAGIERAARVIDPYAVLGLPRSASLEDVKKRYKRLAMIYHPDTGGTDEGFKLIDQAYQQIVREKQGK